jgi:hypothetical protein
MGYDSAKFTTSSPAIASYDFTDIESGLGYVDYFSMTTDLTSGVEYILSDRVEYSTLIATKREGAGTSTLTFDSSVFNRPKTAKGTAIFSCGLAGSAGYGNVTARLAKVVNSTVTYLSSVITGAVININNDDGKMVLLQLPLTETLISEGEFLRLIVTLVTTVNAGVSMEIGHDPKGRDSAFIGTGDNADVVSVMKTSIPFKLEI